VPVPDSSCMTATATLMYTYLFLSVQEPCFDIYVSWREHNSCGDVRRLVDNDCTK
jgi:hypothetical protein